MDRVPGTEGGIFSGTQYDTAYPDGIERHWWTRARSRIVAQMLREAGGAREATLEVGCGRGAAVAGLRELGIDCRGVELAAVAPLPAVRAAVRTGCDARELPATERAGVASILLLDVLEHVADPAAFLAELRAAFPSARRLVVTVPARQELWSNYDDFYGHHRRYDLAMLRALGEGEGWRTRRCAYAFHALYPPARLMSALGLRRGVRLRAPRGAAVALHAALAALMVADWRLLPGSLPGSSAVACFERAAG
jgi:hypothetical protein